MVLAQLRDVDEPVDVVVQLHKRAKTRELGDFAFDEVTDLVFLVDVLPWIFRELFDPEADPLIHFVNVDNGGFDFVVFLKDFAWMIDLAGPAQIGDVDHAVDPFVKLDEGAIGSHVANFPAHGAADGKLLFDLIPGIGLELAQAQRNFLLFFVHAKHDRFHFLSAGENVGRTHDPFGPRKFGDVNETFHAFLDLHEGAVWNEVGDFAFDALTGRETLLDLVPRILLRLLQAQRDALFFLVDVEHDDFQLLADFHELTRMSETAPRHVGDVEQAIHSIQIDERAEVSEIFYRALHLVADLHAFHEFLSLFAPLLLDQFAPAEHDVFAVVVDLDDLEIVGVTDELLQIFRRNDIDLRCRQKCLDADVHHKPAFHDRFHLAFDQAVAVKNTRDLVPILAIRGFFLRENDHAFVVFQSLEEHVHFIANFEILDVLKLGDRNPTLGFVTDIHQHFAWTNFQYPSLDDAAFTEVRHRFRHYILHLHHKLKGLLQARRRSHRASIFPRS